jgi:sterol desaturase/sphingolipid hydroxylase (fatty acid hydroxylase superfamily)
VNFDFFRDPISGAQQIFVSLFQGANDLLSNFLRMGFFDISTLWRQFYDSSGTTDVLRWHSILIYILGCAVFFFFLSRPKKLPSIRDYLNFLVPPAVRRSHSVRVDLQWLVADLLGVPRLIAWILGTGLAFTTVPALVAALHIQFLGASVAKLPDSLRLLLLFVVGLLANEFGLYWAHRLQHYSKFLWQFHKVHHYSRQLNVLTSVRIHPVDNILVDASGGIFMGVALSLLSDYDGGNWAHLYAFAHEYWWFWVLMAIPMISGRFVHTHVPFSLGWGEFVLISPAMHIVHHARDPELHDRNFGGQISLWDWIFGTAYRHDFSKDLELGISEFDDDHYRNFPQAIAEPFLDAIKVVRETASKLSTRFLSE